MPKKVQPTGHIGFIHGGCFSMGHVRFVLSDNSIESEFEKMKEHYGPHIKGKYINFENPQDSYGKVVAALATKSCESLTPHIYKINITEATNILKEVCKTAKGDGKDVKAHSWGKPEKEEEEKDAKGGAKVEAKGDEKAEVAVEAKGEAKDEKDKKAKKTKAKAEDKQELKAVEEAKVDANVDAKVDANVDAKVDVKVDVKVDAKEEPKEDKEKKQRKKAEKAKPDVKQDA